MNPGAVDLLAKVLAGTPRLPRAACRGCGHLFDPVAQGEHPDDADERHAQALAICASCPELQACRAFYGRLPPRKRPVGVTAGQINQPSSRRKQHA